MKTMLGAAAALFILAAAPDVRAADDLYAIAMPGRYEVEPSKVAPDIMVALVATMRSLRGENDLGKGVAPVVLAKDARVAASDRLGDGTAFSYDGYALAGVRLHRLEPSAHGGEGRRLFGVLQFVNGTALRAETAFLIDYTVANKGLVIHVIQTMSATPTDTRVVLRALPKAEGEALLQRKPKDIAAFLDATLAARKPLPQARGEWLLVALSPDRLLAGDRLEIHVGGKGAAAAKDYAGTSLDLAGFPVTAIPWKATGKVEFANVYLRTDMHPDKSDGRRLLATQGLATP
ncbi:MAG: hypothetical protein PSV46_09065 [Reyranella sp.]|nr:hypothetical protein [Reyranella sp.]